MDAFLDTVLTRLAYASLQALALAAVVIAACRLFPALSAAARSTLWWLLGAQLVTGLLCPAPFALPLLPAVAPVVPFTAMPVVLGDMPVDVGSAEWSWSWTAVIVGAWALAILVQLGIATVHGYRVAGIVRRAMPHDDVRVETLCARRARELGLRRSPRLAVSDEVDSPQVVGLWRPTILLPLADRLDDDEREMALMHELAHVRRGDLVLGWIPALARTLFFFHPLVHLATREYALCREAACDALVLSRGRQAPRTYGRLLLRLGVTPHPHHALPGASPTFRTLKRRLDMLGQASDAPPRALTWCLVAAIAVVGVVPWRVVASEEGTVAQAAYPAMPPAPPAPPAAPAPALKAPARPAPMAAPAPAALSAPAPVSPAPPAPPVPMAPPTPPTPPTLDADNAFIYFGGETNVMNGTMNDFRRAEAQRDGAGDYVWYREGKQAWILKDPAYLKRIHDAFARSVQAADGTAMSADKQAELDQRQAVLNEQMAKLAARQADLAVKESGPMGPSDHAAYAAGHAAIGKEQAAIAQKMAEIGRIRAEQGKIQAEWGRRQAEASRRANIEVKAILAEAIRNKAAQAAR